MSKTSQETRREFIQFFEQRGHVYVPSSPVLLADDPTLLFANAGMNQFKDVFLGTGKRPYTRAANTQKCIRAGGKHNDLEDVGFDTYHHTFFEMLGNWSFGDYFKAEAIEWAWELLTKVWGLDRGRLWTTVFGGHADSKLAADDEARALWLKISGLPADRILAGSLKDNFWEMGETGPCGPCTEIHYDKGPGTCDGHKHPGVACAVNVSGCMRYIELWNLVFMQFNRDESGKLSPLPARHVDTGMGFERICAVLQGKASNYDTDVFAPLLAALQDMSGRKYGQDAQADTAFRVIADHARSCSFAIADGVLPSNEGRGYVIRRILRRAARFGRELGQREPFLYKLVDVLGGQMGQVFPEITQRKAQVTQLIREEEESFNRTLDRGLDLFARAAAKAGGGRLGGDVAFELYATFGFPVDLTQLLAQERGLTVDMGGYEQEMQRHRQISAGGGNAFKMEAVSGLPETDDSAKYSHTPLRAKVLGWVEGGALVTTGHLATGAEVAIVLDRTNFYGESGGQVGDSGALSNESGRFEVIDTKVMGHCVLHVGVMKQGTFTPGQGVLAEVSPTRGDIRRNHTATHLLNWALRRVLGGQIDQAGSVVDAQRLRFDFTCGQACKPEQLREVETLVNQRILDDEPVRVETMPLAQAKAIPGVRAVFGEKYPDPVRVVRVGEGDQAANTAAVEFCGGTHLDRTSQAGLFKITAEESVAKGVRRITAVTGHEAVRLVQSLDQVVKAVCGNLRIPPEALPERVEAMQAEIKQLRKHKAAGGGGAGAEGLAASAVTIGSAKVVVGEVEADDVEALRGSVDQIRQKLGGLCAVMIGSRGGDRVTLMAGVSEELVKASRVKAGDWVKAAAAAIGGSGGGKPTMAQAGGKEPEKLPEALAAATEWIKKALGGT